MPLALLLLQAIAPLPATDPAEDLLARHRAATRVEARCARPADANEVTVCARRDADRYRVPFVSTSPRDSVPLERSRLIEPKMAGCGRVGGFYVDCGFVGVTAGVGGGRGVRVKPRDLAP